jgi:hypothetical protein
MNFPAPQVCNVIRYKRPSRKNARPSEFAGYAMRLEGSLAAVVTLAPVIPIFPRLGFSLDRDATPERGELVPFHG